MWNTAGTKRKNRPHKRIFCYSIPVLFFFLMTHTRFLVAGLSCLILASCSTQEQTTDKAVLWGKMMQNPLYAERYYDELVDRLTTMQINKAEELKNPSYAAMVESTKADALQKSKIETQKKNDGKVGEFVPAKEETEGRALLTKDKLFLSPNFLSYPGPSLRLYLSESIDPRDTEFPEDGSLDVGRLESPFGASDYNLPATALEKDWRTIVLYDTKLQRIYGFAQLR